MEPIQTSKTSFLKFGKYKVKVSQAYDGTILFSERDIAFFIGGRGGKKWKSLSAKNLQKIINDDLRSRLINRIKYYQTDRKSIVYGFDSQTVLDICHVWIDAFNQNIIFKTQLSTYNRVKMFHDSLSMIGITALVNEIIKEPYQPQIKYNYRNDQRFLTKSDILSRLRQILH